VSAVSWHVAGTGSPHPVESWWHDLGGRGWLPDDPQLPIVIYLAGAHSRPRSIATARSLLAFLRARMPSAAIEVLDPRGTLGEWPDVSLVDLETRARRRVDSPCIAGGVDIPDRWLNAFHLITIAGAAPDPRYGVAALLTAQSELLADASGRDVDRVFEAHRLLAPDLGIVCGAVMFDSEASSAWWAASPDDIALDCSIAAAAGAEPRALPHVAYIARHAAIATSARASADPPRLAGYSCGTAAVRLARTREAVRHVVASIGTDARLAARNLHRIPEFVQRRWPRLSLRRAS
jgi:hypothetical protein